MGSPTLRLSLRNPLSSVFRQFQTAQSKPYNSQAPPPSRSTPRHFNSQAPRSAPRHFLSIADLTAPELLTLIDLSREAKSTIESGTSYRPLYHTLAGKTIPILFPKHSTRTRVCTEAAVVYLGGHPMFLGNDDIQLGVNEPLYDTSKVSGIVAHVGPHSDIAELAKHSMVPVINALSGAFHPLQVLTDVLTIIENCPTSHGIKLAWVGNAKNVLHAITLGCRSVGTRSSSATSSICPRGQDMLNLVCQACDLDGAVIETTHEPEMAVKGANIIAMDAWFSMGQESEEKLQGIQVTCTERPSQYRFKFKHCFPRTPEEITDEVFYSSGSLVFPEAKNRLYAAIAALEAFVIRNGTFDVYIF